MIKVTHIQASICAVTGQRIDTLIAEYPRCIHSQVLTHRVFSKNSSSTRAIPLHKAIEQLEANPAEFIWTSKQAGMQGKRITDPAHLRAINIRHKQAQEDAIFHAKKQVEDLEVHKQNAGRYLEPFQNIKIVLTSTEWENWDWLRNDAAAQGEIAELAREIHRARRDAEPMVLQAGEWHVPFVGRYRCPEYENLMYFIDDEDQTELDVEEAKLVSMSVCAQTSYRNSDYSLEKAHKMYEMLTGSKRIHASPFEHQATPIGDDFTIEYNADYGQLKGFPKGVTHMDTNGGFLWSANFKGFIQYRQLIKGHDAAKS
jgi:thymidylate synthase ThyX